MNKYIFCGIFFFLIVKNPFLRKLYNESLMSNKYIVHIFRKTPKLVQVFKRTIYEVDLITIRQNRIFLMKLFFYEKEEMKNLTKKKF